MLAGDRSDRWLLGFAAMAVVGLIQCLVGLARDRVVVDASGIVSRRWRTRSWAWSEIARLHRHAADLDRDPEERRRVLLVPVEGRRRPLLFWAPSDRSPVVQRFHTLALQRATAPGVDTAPPPLSGWWLERRRDRTIDPTVEAS